MDGFAAGLECGSVPEIATTILKYTLDTTNLLDLDENRPRAPFVRALIDAHSAGTADLAIVAMSASENQQGSLLTNYADFERSITDLGMHHLDVLFPMGYFDVAFLDRCLWVGDVMVGLEKRIHSILFSHKAIALADFVESVRSQMSESDACSQ